MKIEVNECMKEKIAAINALESAVEQVANSTHRLTLFHLLDEARNGLARHTLRQVADELLDRVEDAA